MFNVPNNVTFPSAGSSAKEMVRGGTSENIVDYTVRKLFLLVVQGITKDGIPTGASHNGCPGVKKAV